MEQNPYKAPGGPRSDRHALSAMSIAWTSFLVLTSVVLAAPCLFLVDDTATPAHKAMFELSQTLLFRGLGLLAAVFVPLSAWTCWRWMRA